MALTLALGTFARTLFIAFAMNTDFPVPDAPTTTTTGEGFVLRSKKSIPVIWPVGVQQIRCGRFEPPHTASVGMSPASESTTSVISLPVGLGLASPTSDLA